VRKARYQWLQHETRPSQTRAEDFSRHEITSKERAPINNIQGIKAEQSHHFDFLTEAQTIRTEAANTPSGEFKRTQALTPNSDQIKINRALVLKL